MALTKKQKTINPLVDKAKLYASKEALEIVKQGAKAKFDETVELAVHLGVDPKQSDQQVRGVVMLPGGSGVSRRVAVFVKGEKEKEAARPARTSSAPRISWKRSPRAGWISTSPWPRRI